MIPFFMNNGSPRLAIFVVTTYIQYQGRCRGLEVAHTRRLGGPSSNPAYSSFREIVKALFN